MGTHTAANNACGCRAINVPVLQTSSTSKHSPEKSSDAKYFQEIGAEMIGNQLIIRVEKDKNKSSKRKTGQWDPPCDCSIPEIRMPSSTEGPKIMNAGDNNQILFRIRSRTLVGKDETDYKPEAFTYQLGNGKKGKDANDQHRSITVHPNLSDPSRSQEIHSDHITDGNQNIYLLRIKKKNDLPGERKRNIELELRTPKPPTPRQQPRISRKLDDVKIPQPEVEMKVVTTKKAKPGKKDKAKKKKKKK